MKNNEFKIKKFKDSTVYTLESASSGGTSAGSVASVNKPIGVVQRRAGDNFFTQEDADPIKPRRGPLRPQTGGGEHKDRTKTIPRKEKHKKPMDMSEAEEEYGPEWQAMVKRVGQRAKEGPRKTVWDPVKQVYTTAPINPPKKKEQGMGEGRYEYDKKTGQMGHSTADTDQRHGLYIDGKLVKTYNSREQANNVKQRDPKFRSATIKKIAEDHEIQMASSELMSIAKDAESLLDLVRRYSEQEGLDAWQQSKITKAADYLNSVLQAVSGEQTDREMSEVAPKGWEGTVKSMKKHKDEIDNPWALANWMKGKGYKSHKRAKEDHSTASQGYGQGGYDTYAGTNHGRGVMEDQYVSELFSRLSEKLDPNAPVDVWVQDFQQADPNRYHQFKNKTPAKKAQMAASASYAAKNPSKKR